VGIQAGIKRRGLLALAPVVGAALLPRLGSPQTVEAANGDQLRAGQSFTETNPFVLANQFGAVTLPPSADLGTGPAFGGVDNAEGVKGFAGGPNGRGVMGVASSGRGVYGSASNGNGVYGRATDGAGVYAEGFNGPGLFAESDFNSAIVANTTGNTSPAIYGNSGTGMQLGVYGRSISSLGVLGRSDSGIGSSGASTNGTGAKGFSTNSNGVEGRSGGGGAGVAAYSQSGLGLYATSATGGAARFDGNVIINGNLTLLGSKAAAVKRSDGTLQEMYAVEAPESYFEGFGRGQLNSGRVTVRLDSDFADTVKPDDYDVFVTPYGQCNGLAVTRRSAAAFEVEELRGGSSSVDFSYRIVAKRKDLVGKRMARVELGAAPRRTADVPKVPELRDLIPEQRRIPPERGRR